MKPLLLLLLSCFCYEWAMAQDEQKTLPKFKPERPLIYRYPKEWKATILPDSTIHLRDFALRNKKPGVYRLPQDNMPCIVPDSSKSIRIPNAWKGPKRIPYQSNPPRIPNPGSKWVPTPIANTDSNTK